MLVTGSLHEAARDVEAKLSGKAFGDAGRRVVIEEALSGQEVSVIAMCDGRRAYPLAAAQDFKRVGDGGTGANTGGMGAYSPVPFAEGRARRPGHGAGGPADSACPAQAGHRLPRCPVRRGNVDRRRPEAYSSSTCASGTPRLRC